MGKKAWITIGLTLVLLVVAGCAVWLNVTRVYEKNNPFDHIPASAMAVYKINGVSNYASCFYQADYKYDLREIVEHDKLVTAYDDVDSILSCADIVAPAVRVREFYIAIFDMHNVKENLVFSMKLKNYVEGVHVTKMLGQSENFSVRDTVVAGDDVMLLTVAERNYYMSIIDGCLFLSNNAVLMEHVSNNESDKLSHRTSFTTLERTASDNAIVSLFVNTRMLNSIMKNDVIDFTRVAEWIELDLDIEKKTLSANGFAASSGRSSLIALANNKPKEFTIDRYIPSNAKLFISYVEGDRGLSNEAYLYQLAQDNRQGDYRAKQEELFKKYGTDVENLMSQVFSGDLAVFSTSESLRDTANTCLVVSSDNGTITQASLNSLTCTLHGVEMPSQVGELNPTPDVTVPIYKAFDDDDELFFLKDLFAYVPHRYYLRYENALFLADNIETLKAALYENQLSRTLANDVDFRNFRSTYSDENISFVYIGSDVLTKYVMENSITSDELKRRHAANNFYGLGVQISSLGGLKLPYLTLSLHHEPDRLQMPPTAWQSRLDTTLIGRPWGVINHNTGEIEYLVQDAKNCIHLINPQGLVLWSFKLESPIVGNVTQIDYYNNRKLQLLFATTDHIYLIDRNGRNTAEFPIRLQSEAAGGVTYIDYGNPTDFRLFIAGTDKFIHLYDKECKLIQGWEMSRTDGIASTPVKHYVTGNKDYLIMADEFRYYITDRRGNERVKLPVLAPNRNRDVALIKKNTPQAAFVMATADGLFTSTEIASGKTTSKPIEGMTKEQPYDMVYNSERRQFAVVTPKKLLILNEEGKRVGSYDISLSTVDHVELLSDGTLALWDKDDALAYRYSFDGELMTGYPLPASSPYVMATQYGVNNIVVISKDGALYSFLRK